MDGNEIDENALFTRISDLFSICDVERKGYVTRDDLFRLQDELGLEDADVHSAFDQLDTDGNNCLTLDEFVAGFGLFLGVEQNHPKEIKGVQADFAFQVFSLIDRDDKGHITKADLFDAAETLELSGSDVDDIFERLKTLGTGDEFVIRFEDFANEINDITSRSVPLQEIRKGQSSSKPSKSRSSLLSDNFDGKAALASQAEELFRLCDREGKNYITKNDLQGLMQELALSKEQVDSVFKKLDSDRNGFLTLDEFVSGFGLFLGVSNEETSDPFLQENYERAQELFNLCDSSQKGYVTKHDLLCLTTELSINEDLIVQIFDELDVDKNGFITMYEFTQGFSSLFSDKGKNLDDKYFSESRRNKLESSSNSHSSADHFLDRRGSVDSRTSKKNFISRQMSVRFESGMVGINEVLDNLVGEVGSAISKDQVQQLWAGVSNTDQMTVRMFEEFLGKVYGEIRAAKQEAKHLEDVLEKKSQTHDEEIKKIYDDMEMQMRQEKARVLEEEAFRERQAREEIVLSLADKEKQIQKMLQRQQGLEERLKEIRDKENDLKVQNQKLLKENVVLEDRLNESMSDLQETKSYINQLQKQTAIEKKETLKAAVQATQGIHSEHESLLKQLDVLKSMNQKLRDDRDAIEANLKSKVALDPTLEAALDSINGSAPTGFQRLGSQIDSYIEKSRNPSSSTPNHSPLTKQGSVMSMYFGGVNTDHRHEPIHDDDDDDNASFNQKLPGYQDRRYLDSIGEQEEIEALAPVKPPRKKSGKVDESFESEAFKANGTATPSTSPSTPPSPRHAPVGKDGDNESRAETVSPTPSLGLPPENPSRLYKIVFVGDSGVGKSSFIHRFCFDDFRANFSATIGVDFQVKTIKINKQWVALQLWDTAGQERFRSITKQYFRRADGVVIMFDLSCESSFTNVKGWMNSVEEGAEPDCTLMLLGNKKDLVDQVASARKVTFHEGQRVAQTYNGMYFEVSAKSGDGVVASMEKFAQILEMHEDAVLQHSVLNLKLNDTSETEKKKKKCCGK